MRTRLIGAIGVLLIALLGATGLRAEPTVSVTSFTTDPSIASSLKFLRKTPWAREKVESLYLFMLRQRARHERQ